MNSISNTSKEELSTKDSEDCCVIPCITSVRPACPVCEKTFANPKSLATHKNKWHKRTTAVILDSSNINVEESPNKLQSLLSEAVLKDVYEELKWSSNCISQKKRLPKNPKTILKRHKKSISAGELCHMLRPNLNLPDVIDIISYFTNLTQQELSFLNENEKVYIKSLIEERYILKVFDGIREDCDYIRKIIGKILIGNMEWGELKVKSC